MKQTIYLLCGIPASGKSTYAKYTGKKLIEEGHTVSYISRDEVRFSILKDEDDYFAHENEVFNEFINRINQAIHEGIEAIFVDATHISEASREKVLRRLDLEGLDVCPIVFHTPLHVCLKRNASRTGRAKVPASAIKNMAKGFSNPELDARHYASITHYN